MQRLTLENEHVFPLCMCGMFYMENSIFVECRVGIYDVMWCALCLMKPKIHNSKVICMFSIYLYVIYVFIFCIGAYYMFLYPYMCKAYIYVLFNYSHGNTQFKI